MNITMELASITFPYVQAQAAINVIDAWMQNGQLNLTLEHPGSKHLIDVPVTAILDNAGNKYLVLLLCDSFSDPPRTTYPVLRYYDREHLYTIDYEEFQPLSIMSSGAQDLNKMLSFAAVAFALPADQPSLQQQEELRNELTEQVYLGGVDFVAPGTQVQVLRRECYGESIWFELGNAKAEKQRGRLLLLYVRPVADQLYCIFVYPPEQTAEDPAIKKIILKFVDPDLLEVLSAEQLRRVKGELIRSITNEPNDSVNRVENLFGGLARP
jgi:hypothetical protein